jgi:hypothetical protein
MLTLYRRHLDACPHATKGRNYKRCKCPIWVDGTYVGMEVRRSLKTASWDDAERRLAALKESPGFTFQQPKTVADAVVVYLADASAGQNLTEETLRKKRNVLNPLVNFCNDKGKQYLKQITFEDLTEFRQPGQVKHSAHQKSWNGSEASSDSASTLIGSRRVRR